MPTTLKAETLRALADILRVHFPYVKRQDVNRPVVVHWFDVVRAIEMALLEADKDERVAALEAENARIDELQQTLDDAEDALVEDFMRPDSAMRARCTVCKGEAFHRESIEHQKHCFVGNIRRALGKDQAS